MSDINDELIPCPECGGKAHIIFNEKRHSRAVYIMFARCSECGYTGRSTDCTASQAVSYWNSQDR